MRAIELFGREDDARSPMTGGSGSGGPSCERQPGADGAALEAEQGHAGHVPHACCRRGSPGRSGFEDVAPHHRYPRLRFELGRDIGWKAEVESALEKLFTVITVPASPSPLVPELVGQR